MASVMQRPNLSDIKTHFCLQFAIILIRFSVILIALRKAKMADSFGLAECNRVKTPSF